MAKQSYISKRFRADTMTVIERAEAVINEYVAAGYTLTLRQAYYQMIARDLFPESWIDRKYNREHELAENTKNTEKNYKNFGSILNDARLAGLIDWDAIEDRGRNMVRVSTWDDPRHIIASARYSFKLDPWKDQPRYVQVWIEKEALIGVIERPCDLYRLPYIACKGYMSQSEMRAQALRMQRAKCEGKEVWLLHLGDHDPSGIQMSEDIQGRMDLFMGGVDFNRLALNMPQIQELGPPPNPAKLTDSRYASYVRQFNIDDSWELDALTPDYISELITNAVVDLIDWDAWETTMRREKEEQAALVAVERNWTAVVQYMGMNGWIPEVEEDDDDETE